MSMAVPERLRGLWRRTSIAWPDGSQDRETTALWAQADRLFCDIRVPAARPAPRARGFAGLSVDDAVAMAAQEGFAGALRVTGDRCDWERMIDFRPLGTPDAGIVEREGDVMVERGLGGAYVEHWACESGAHVLSASALDAASGAIAVMVGDVVMTAVDRRPSPPPPGALAELAADAARAGDEAGLAGLLDCEVCFGRRSGAAEWTVELSTLPWLAGAVRALPLPQLARLLARLPGPI